MARGDDVFEQLFRSMADSRSIRPAADLRLEHAPAGLDVLVGKSRNWMQTAIEAGAREGVNAELLTVLKALHGVTYAIGRSLPAGHYAVADLITRGGKTVRGELLQRHFHGWRRTVAPGTAETPQAWLESLRPYIEADSLADVPFAKRRLIMVLKTLIGDNLDEALARTAVPRLARDARPMLSQLRFLHPKRTDATVNVMDEFLDIGRSEAAITEAVETSFRNIRQIVDDNPELAEKIGETMDAFDNPASQTMLAEITATLLRKFSTDEQLANLDPALLGRIVRSSKNSGQHVMDEIVLAQLMVLHRFRDVEAVGMLNGLGMTAPQLLHAFLRFPGAEGFFQTILSRNPHEHAFVFEQLISMNLFAALMRKGMNAAEHLVIQVLIDRKAGPDNIVIVIEEGLRIARLIQAKSYQVLSRLLREARSATDLSDELALGEAGGEIVRQTWSDLKRTMRAGGRLEDPNTGRILDIDQYDAVQRSKIDLERAWLDTSLFDNAFETALKAELAAKNVVTDRVKEASVSAMELKDLVFSRDPKILEIVGATFRALHIDPHLMPLKTEIAAIPSLYAEQVKKLDLAQFQSEFLAPAAAKTNWTAKYETLVRLFTEKGAEGLTDAARAAKEDAIRDAFLAYFEAMYKCPNGTLEVEFDVMSILADVDTSRGVIRISDRNLSEVPGPTLIDFE